MGHLQGKEVIMHRTMRLKIVSRTDRLRAITMDGAITVTTGLAAQSVTAAFRATDLIIFPSKVRLYEVRSFFHYTGGIARYCHGRLLVWWQVFKQPTYCREIHLQNYSNWRFQPQGRRNSHRSEGCNGSQQN